MTQNSDNKWLIRVGLGSCGLAAGGRKVFDALDAALRERKLDVTLKPTGCMGMCYNEVLVEVAAPHDGRVFYRRVKPEQVTRIVEEHVIGGRPVAEWVIPAAEIEGLLAKQKRVILARCGVIDPESLEDYLEAGGYQALKKALGQMTSQQVIDEVTRSGLRGRGGAGFSTGAKWGLARKSPGTQKYLVCNADEGDPGAFMNRSVLESDPHSVLEGMVIAGYAIGATEGYIYCRAEKPLAIERVELAVEQAQESGFLGENIYGSGFDFNLEVRRGAGAFVCGEETALMASIEGKRGMPRVRPPFPAQSGLWGKPTNINNVETFANIPWIVLHGAEAYSAFGSEKSKGTKVFALAGKIARSGLVEVPMGITVKEIVFDIGGGTSSGLPFKAVQMGGPSGGVIPASLADTHIDYDSVTRTGAIMGSGGLIVMDETSCMVDVAKFFLNFTQDESCGKCTLCRIGTLRMMEILERISEGKGKPEDLTTLEELAATVKRSSLCGLGQTAPNPVLTTLKYFRSEYEAHILDKRCPAKKCRALISYEVIADRCKGCRLCAKNCPAGAVSGELKKVHIIDQAKCLRCGLCVSVCKLDAIAVREGGLVHA